MHIKKIIYITIGCISLGLGTIGSVLPFLPTVPFLLLSAFCFAKSSEKLDMWFKSTKIYKNNLESFVRGAGMTYAYKNKNHDYCNRAAYHRIHNDEKIAIMQNCACYCLVRTLYLFCIFYKK